MSRGGSPFAPVATLPPNATGAMPTSYINLAPYATDMKRRTLVASLGTVTLGSIAGCSGGSGGDETATETATATATETATATTTETATETTTETATATPTAATHAVGERFVVGEGNDAVPYTVGGFRRSDWIGREGIGEGADGAFLIMLLTVENVRNSTRDVPTGNIVVRGDGVRRNVDQRATEAVQNDDRIDEESLAFATMPGGQPRTGVLVYDVPLDNAYRVEFTPTGGSGEPHYVEVGAIDGVTALEEESF